jgi:16S rRNA (cytosine1402-N4)-methyltransferase
MDEQSPDTAHPTPQPDMVLTPANATHVPVLLDRVLTLLAPALADRPAVVVDATLGLGGHSAALLAAHPQLTLVGLDRDPVALARSRERLAEYTGRIHLVHAVYDEMPDVLADLGLDGVDGVLFDLGVSSMQLDVSDRGFGYAHDGPLDMRMDQSAPRTAEQVVNSYPVPQLARVLREYGEERFALRIAQAIDRARRDHRLNSTAELADLVRDAIPAATRRHGGHPAKRTFQALRIEVNGELDAVRAAVPAALGALHVGGRFVALAYHSLEDRIVKQALAVLATDQTPAGLPVQLADRGPQLRLLSRGSEAASAAEIAANPRAASVRLRAAERIRESA